MASEAREEAIQVDLRDPNLAALLAWLWPGAGHLYQRRYAKGLLFMVCVLSTWFFGLIIGGGHVVYASWSKEDWRWQYVCQMGVGAPAMPALVQSVLVSKGMEPIKIGGVDIMAPPGSAERLSQWYYEWHSFFEMGTLYTMVAGLLNILAIYDAYAGPAPPAEDEKPPDEDDEDDSSD